VKLFDVARKGILMVAAAAAVILFTQFSYGSEAVVFDFETNGNFTEDWAAPALTDFTIRLLSTQTKWKALERDRLARLISRWPVEKRGALSFETRDAIRQHLGAKFLIEGRLENDRSGFRFVGTLINPDSGDVADISFQMKKFELEAAQKKLLQNLKKALSGAFNPKMSTLQGTGDADAYRLYWKGIRLYEKGLPDKALPLLEKAVSRDKQYIEPALMVGRIFLDKAFFSKAVEKFRFCVDTWPSDARAHFLLGLTYYLQRMNPPARAEFHKAVDLDPGNPEYYYQLGLLEKETFRYDEAVENLEKAVELDSSLYDGWYQLAVIYASAKQESKTLECLDKAAAWGDKAVFIKMRNDADFAWLRNNGKFQSILIRQPK